MCVIASGCDISHLLAPMSYLHSGIIQFTCELMWFVNLLTKLLKKCCLIDSEGGCESQTETVRRINADNTEGWSHTKDEYVFYNKVYIHNFSQ